MWKPSQGASRKEWFEEPTVAQGEIPIVEIRVEPIASLGLEGVVVDESGTAILGVSISVNDVTVAESGDAGVWRVDGSSLGAGPWKFSFQANGYEELSFTLPRPEYLLLDDARSVHLTMEKER